MTDRFRNGKWYSSMQGVVSDRHGWNCGVIGEGRGHTIYGTVDELLGWNAE